MSLDYIIPNPEAMTLRDYFAAKAMAAYLLTTPNNRPPEKVFAEAAYFMADAMLAAREAK